MVALARARYKVFFNGKNKGPPFYGDNTEGTFDFLVYLLQFVGWRPANSANSAKNSAFGAAEEPQQGRMNVVHQNIGKNSGHYFLVDLRKCDEVVKDVYETRYKNADILDSANGVFQFKEWFIASNCDNNTFIVLEAYHADLRKTHVMKEIMKVADIRITAKVGELAFFGS